MKKVIFPLLIIILGLGCVTLPSYNYPPIETKKREMVNINFLAKEKKLKYQYNTMDDILKVDFSAGSAKFLLGTPLMYLNGQVFSLPQAPIYKEGNIYVPAEAFSFSTPKYEPKIAFAPLRIQRIVIDPGHGGKDPGAISPWGLKEKDLNLSVARYLKAELEKRGYRVLLTRNKDIYLTLKQRVKFAHRHQADFFISIHANANHSRRIRGIEVYYLSDNYLDTETKAVLLAENNALEFDRSKYFSKTTEKILWDLICVENNNQSLEFASLLLRTFSSLGLRVHYLSPKGAPFYVLKYACTPSILIEMGYLTNRREEKLLRSSYYQRQIAHAIAFSIDLLNKKYADVSNK